MPAERLAVGAHRMEALEHLLALGLGHAGPLVADRERNAGAVLARLAKARGTMTVRDATIAARDAGRNYITVASEFLGQDA